MIYHLLKVKSKDKIPDFLQIRDRNFVLKGYHRLDRPFGDPHAYGLAGKETLFWQYVANLPFNEVVQIDLPDGLRER